MQLHRSRHALTSLCALPCSPPDLVPLSTPLISAPCAPSLPSSLATARALPFPQLSLALSSHEALRICRAIRK